MRELLDTEQHLNAHEQALDEIHQKLHRGEEIVSSFVPLDIPMCSAVIRPVSSMFMIKACRRRWMSTRPRRHGRNTPRAITIRSSSRPYTSVMFPLTSCPGADCLLYCRRCTIQTPQCRRSPTSFLEVRLYLSDFRRTGNNNILQRRAMSATTKMTYKLAASLRTTSAPSRSRTLSTH